MIPLLEHYRAYPDAFHLLPTAMGSITGQMANIDPATGATSMGFHSFPFALEFDPHSGDYGLGFFGHSIQTGAYLVTHPTPGVGYACFLCSLASQNATGAVLTPTDAYHARVFLEPVGTHLVAQAGTFAQVSVDFAARTATLLFAPAAAAAGSRPFSNLRLHVEKTSAPGLRPGSAFTLAYAATGAAIAPTRGGFDIAPNSDDSQPTAVVLSWMA